MTIAEKLTLIAENQQKVYDAGYEKGKAEGGSATPKNPTFRAKFPCGAISTYEFEEGMTWTEWLGSEYNCNCFYDNGFGSISENYTGTGRWVYSEDSVGKNSISGDTVIEKDYQYVVE